MEKNSKIYIAGHRGVAGRAIRKILAQKGYHNIVTRTHEELDLTDQNAVNQFFEVEKPEYVFLLAARVGGIVDKTKHPVDFWIDNLKIQINVIENAYRLGAKKLLFMGSVYAYPAETIQPIKEGMLLSGSIGSELDEPYAISKIAGIKMCEAYYKQYGCKFFSVMPCVFFGEGSSFDLTKASVVPSMIRRMHEAKIMELPEFEIWGTGKPVREFLSGNDVGRACVFLMEEYDESGYFNLGNGGNEISIAEISQIIKEVVGYEGQLVFNTEKPDGMMRKTMDSSKLFDMGWQPQDTLKETVRETYQYFLQTIKEKEK